jgi:hypothetical protein
MGAGDIDAIIIQVLVLAGIAVNPNGTVGATDIEHIIGYQSPEKLSCMTIVQVDGTVPSNGIVDDIA